MHKKTALLFGTPSFLLLFTLFPARGAAPALRPAGSAARRSAAFLSGFRADRRPGFRRVFPLPRRRLFLCAARAERRRAAFAAIALAAHEIADDVPDSDRECRHDDDEEHPRDDIAACHSSSLLISGKAREKGGTGPSCPGDMLRRICENFGITCPQPARSSTR